MKRVFVFISCLLLLSCSLNNGYNENNDEVNGCVWDYPVKPGMEEWKQFHSNEEKVNACQIPENIVCCLSTEKLTEICLQYPLLADVFAFNFLSMGADKLFEDFNGIRELCLLHGHEKEIVHYDPNFSYPFPINLYARAHVIIKISPQSIEKIPYKDKNNVFYSSLGTDKEPMNIINELSYELIK